MRPYPRFAYLLAALLGLGPLSRAQAQTGPSTGFNLQNVGPSAEGVITVSGDSVDRLRLAEQLGSAPLEGLMLRSTGTLTDPRRNGMRPRLFTLVLPELIFVNNTSLPFGLVAFCLTVTSIPVFAFLIRRRISWRRIPKCKSGRSPRKAPA